MYYYITGEGPTDYAQYNYSDDKWEKGPATIILEKSLIQKKEQIDSIDFIDKIKIKEIKLQRSLSNLKNRGIPCAKFLTLIKTSVKEIPEEQIVAVFYTDADKCQGEKNTSEITCKKLFRELSSDIQDAVNLFNLKCVIMMPIKMIENWLLADDNAFKITFDTDRCPELPSKPELIWGEKNNPKSNYPKHVISRMFFCNSFSRKFATKFQ